jgi:hypothetical protein
LVKYSAGPADNYKQVEMPDKNGSSKRAGEGEKYNYCKPFTGLAVSLSFIREVTICLPAV